MLLILLTWLCLWFVLSLIGLGFIKIITGEIDFLNKGPTGFWLGWALTIGYLQIWHLFFKVSGLTWIPILLAAICGLLLIARDLWAFIRRLSILSLFSGTALLLIPGLWIANQAQIAVSLYDTALYHVQMILWNSTYPVVPGLGNLHFRFAFNNSSLLYATLLNIGPWDGKAFHIANGLLLWLLVLEAILGIWNLFYRSGKRIAHVFPALAIIAVLASWSDIEHQLVSYSTDIILFFLGLIIANLSIKMWYKPWISKKEGDFYLFSISILAFTGITIKLSFLGIGIPAILVGLIFRFFLHQNQTQDRKLFSTRLACVTICGLLILVPWMIRGILLSGYPLFPLTWLPMNVDWRVPVYRAVHEQAWIESWARKPGPHFINVIYDWNWFPDWLDRLPDSFTDPLRLSVASLMVYLILLCKEKFNSRLLRDLLLIPPIVATIMWFMIAPDPRFLGSSLWIFAFLLLIQVTTKVEDPLTQKISYRWVYLLPIFLILFFIHPADMSLFIPRWSPEPVPNAFSRIRSNYLEETTKSGLTLKVPRETDQCWDTPIPCTPYFDKNLSLRDPSNMGKGFKTDLNAPLPHPLGFSIPPDIGLVLASGWQAADDAENAWWIASQASVAIYSANPREIQILFTPLSIPTLNERDQFVRLRITSGEKAYELTLREGVISSITVPIGDGFSRLGFEVFPGSSQVENLQVDSTNQVDLVVEFSKIEITNPVP